MIAGMPHPHDADDELRSLIHRVTQPLTTLQCVLESALGQNEKVCSEAVVLALQQTTRAIEVVRLMQEHFEVVQK